MLYYVDVVPPVSQSGKESNPHCPVVRLAGLGLSHTLCLSRSVVIIRTVSSYFVTFLSDVHFNISLSVLITKFIETLSDSGQRMRK